MQHCEFKTCLLCKKYIKHCFYKKWYSIWCIGLLLSVMGVYLRKYFRLHSARVKMVHFCSTLFCIIICIIAIIYIVIIPLLSYIAWLTRHGENCGEVAEMSGRISQWLETTLCPKKTTLMSHYRFNPHQPISVIFGGDLLREYAIEWWFIIPPLLTNVSALPRKHEPGNCLFSTPQACAEVGSILNTSI